MKSSSAKAPEWVLPERIDSPVLQESDLLFFCSALEGVAGISIKSSKRDLVQMRLRTRLLELGLADYSEYRRMLQGRAKKDPEWQTFINLLTTNKTDFFRESKHFEFLTQNILPDWTLEKSKPGEVYKVWSAASSTGEEAFTLAMVLNRHLPKGFGYNILGSDVDTEVLATASNAVYPASRISEIPVEYRQESIGLGRGNSQGWFRMRSSLKTNVHFKHHNLIDSEIPGEEMFDLVLCRNILIYFQRDTIENVIQKIFRSIKVGGYLMIGHSESLQGLRHVGQSVGPSIFKKNSRS